MQNEVCTALIDKPAYARVYIHPYEKVVHQLNALVYQFQDLGIQCAYKCVPRIHVIHYIP
jgi:hypothetical protein